MRRRPELAAMLLVAAAPAMAEGWRLDRAAELPAHRALAAARLASGDALSPFETDGCSGGLSAVWTFVATRFPAFAAAQGDTPPWEACCVGHDRIYHTAGDDPDPVASFDARLAADAALRACVLDTLGDTAFGLAPDLALPAAAATAEAMFLAVRLGGGPCTGLPWRWGYGRSACTPFRGMNRRGCRVRPSRWRQSAAGLPTCCRARTAGPQRLRGGTGSGIGRELRATPDTPLATKAARPRKALVSHTNGLKH